MTARRQCVRCGRSQPRERLVFSHYTRAYFCTPAEWAACDRRAKRRAKIATPVEFDPSWGDAMLAANIGLTPVRLRP
jgi:hypothetical protein